MKEPQDSDTVEDFNIKAVDWDPIGQFRRWFEDAIASGSRLPESMTLATATTSGRPSARVVLLKHVDESGFVFYTNYRSAKAKELEENPQAALVFYWEKLDRQIRVEGTVERVSAQESDEYFKTRPRDSQLGALASPQSEEIESREVLENKFRELDKLYRNRPIDRPTHWGGYRLKPSRVEFWQNRPGRLHDRIVYERQGDAAWTIKRLAP
jgi:pyridoxamine 5'-phosphate oxidase